MNVDELMPLAPAKFAAEWYLRPAAIAFSPDNEYLAAGGQHIKIWSAESKPPATAADPQSRLQELIAQVKDLHNSLEALSADLKNQQPAPDSAEKK